MFKFIQRLFNSKMDSEDYDMLDILAFNCNQLSADLVDSEDQNRTLFDYLTKADTTYKSINNFKDGKTCSFREHMLLLSMCF